MVAPHAPYDALLFQLAAIAGRDPGDRLIEVRYRVPGGMRQLFHPAAGDLRPLIGRILGLGQKTDTFIGMGLRRARRGTREFVEPLNVAWVDIDDAAGITRLAGFHPWPDFVNRSGGGGVHALWLYRQAVALDEGEHVNRLLATHLGADPQSTDAARVLRSSGTLNWKYATARLVVCTRLHRPARGGWTVGELLADVPELEQPPPPVPLRPCAQPSRSGDPLLAIPSSTFVPRLTGREVGRDGKVRCPFHKSGAERTPSLQVWDDPGRGYFCWGTGCGGGSVYDFGSRLYGISPRGADFHRLRERLLADLLPGDAQRAA